MEQLGTNCQAIKGHNLKFEFQKRRGEKNTSRIKIILKHKEKSCTKNSRLLLVKRSPKVHQNLKNGAITNQIQVWFIKQQKPTFLKVITLLSRRISPYQYVSFRKCTFFQFQFTVNSSTTGTGFCPYQVENKLPIEREKILFFFHKHFPILALYQLFA